MKGGLIGKDLDAGKDWRQEEKGTTQGEMVGGHNPLSGHEFEQAPGVGDGRGGLACCSPWGCRVRTRLSKTEQQLRNQWDKNYGESPEGKFASSVDHWQWMSGDVFGYHKPKAGRAGDGHGKGKGVNTLSSPKQSQRPASDPLDDALTPNHATDICYLPVQYKLNLALLHGWIPGYCMLKKENLLSCRRFW